MRMPVDAKQLTPEQADRLCRAVARHLRFFNRLCGRMNELHVAPDDPLYRAAHVARAATQDLHVAALYARCRRGVGT